VLGPLRPERRRARAGGPRLFCHSPLFIRDADFCYGRHRAHMPWPIYPRFPGIGRVTALICDKIFEDLAAARQDSGYGGAGTTDGNACWPIKRGAFGGCPG
jgi:hypothetical protein